MGLEWLWLLGSFFCAIFLYVLTYIEGRWYNKLSDEERTKGANKMKFYIKETYVATENNKTYPKGTKHITYIGVGGYCSDNPDYVEKWSRRRFADNYIRNANEWDVNHPNLSTVNWSTTREVIEI